MDEFYRRKLYALLQSELRESWQCFSDSTELESWWENNIVKNSLHLSEAIASSSDRVNLIENLGEKPGTWDKVRHPISAEERSINTTSYQVSRSDIDAIAQEKDAEKVFWWMWRFCPELWRQQNQDALLIPAHHILPDCPEHSYRATVSALVGALFPDNWHQADDSPCLLLFTFSPVQEFIKASRKFLDFWAGSYLLHYLGAKICWAIAEKYGPDAIITPSLWSQEIIDALILQKYPDFASSFNHLTDIKEPETYLADSTSLRTAGFPNVITALVPGKDVNQLGEELGNQLREEWKKIAKNVREHIKQCGIEKLTQNETIWSKISAEFASLDSTKDKEHNPYYQELNKFKQHSNWEWNHLWDAQVENTWETYWTAVPFGHPNKELQINLKDGTTTEQITDWEQAQNQVAQPKQYETIPNEVEEKFYQILNVGTWWPSLQSRLGQGIQSIKNTRTWAIPPAPGERSTLSGQFSAVHFGFLYNQNRTEGGGLPASSMRLFWRVMAELYSGLFNGSEKLNAIELTKRMAWEYGGVAESLGIQINNSDGKTDYEQLIRFPNLSSIASARFAYNCPEKIRFFWKELEKLIRQELPSDRRDRHKKFWSRTRGRPFQVPKTDTKIDQTFNQAFNGVMFSSKWLADDMGLENKQDLETLRGLVDQAHKNSGFADGSPADWWVIVLGDGDSMGKYVSGSKLHNYEQYLVKDAVAEEIRQTPEFAQLCNIKKRMGPATHVGLNRALLDFSNRIVPHLTEQRFCGKVVYSGGDDVMAVLPLEDLPEYLRSLRAAWSGKKDPYREQPPDDVDVTFINEGGYWQPESKSGQDLQGLPDRPLFTMGSGATMSLGIVIAYKSVPLPTVLETLWGAEKERAKKLPGKDGLCFRVIYGGGNVLEAVMKGTLLESWWQFIQCATIGKDISPLLYRLAEELPRRAVLTENYYLFREAASVIWDKTQISEVLPESTKQALLDWLTEWEDWAWNSPQKWKEQQAERKKEQGEPCQLEAENSHPENPPLGISPEDLGKLLRFSAFWVDKKLQREKWQQGEVSS